MIFKVKKRFRLFFLKTIFFAGVHCKVILSLWFLWKQANLQTKYSCWSEFCNHVFFWTSLTECNYFSNPFNLWMRTIEKKMDKISILVFTNLNNSEERKLCNQFWSLSFRVCHMKENTLWNDSSHLRSIKACQDQCKEIPSFNGFTWTPACLWFEIWG